MAWTRALVVLNTGSYCAKSQHLDRTGQETSRGIWPNRSQVLISKSCGRRNMPCGASCWLGCWMFGLELIVFIRLGVIMRILILTAFIASVESKTRFGIYTVETTRFEVLRSPPKEWPGTISAIVVKR